MESTRVSPDTAQDVESAKECLLFKSGLIFRINNFSKLCYVYVFLSSDQSIRSAFVKKVFTLVTIMVSEGFVLNTQIFIYPIAYTISPVLNQKSTFLSSWRLT
ncbi:unnamed protein product [Nippostrongylus brasiliensis]|uniref:Uncharacterized protein n=1 Tax=Nippostrongylus brasiliensis TaxID=27835 RepID=A0A0N4YMK9_NIPBR|nr:unnamed protein product [Nippostrongylus brasiliensis]